MVQDGSIFCELHGQQSSAALCSHLVKGAGLGFNAGDPTPENPSPDAFCDTCWKILEEENGWSDRAQRLVPCSIVCGVCYIGIRLRNIVEWEFPEIGVDIRSDLAARQSLLCAACGVATDMESGKVSFVFPPHAAMSPDLIAWTTSTDNLVLLCSKCFDGIKVIGTWLLLDLEPHRVPSERALSHDH
jgi:hypothetical protein